ncbi:response regulator [Fuerstiella marisgermanici]|uniref:Response regulator rcp1 n=1 Tax=Fuerstiella marisgermanici TaxID=1891926 RepID=A0A1P8WA98_9PLAN|nr:response regulator [Fuerstiella marisgermanici]APZ90987.1 Response regulator rcp1 [Fuerstiella marisgermanici]
MTEQNATVLIVEDDEVDVELVTRGLKKRSLPFGIHAMTDGSTALEFMRRKMPTDEQQRLIVLLDLNMPRMNGHEFLAELRRDESLRKTIVFVLTTSSLEADRSQAYDNNVAGYFVKSNMDGLLDMLGIYADHVEFPSLSSAG